MKNLKFKWLLLSIILSVAGISQVWADTYKLEYQAGLPTGYYTIDPATGGISVSMTASSNDGSRYYYEATLSASTTYGFYVLKNDTKYVKSTGIVSNNNYKLLYEYDNNNADRVEYTPSSAGVYVFTYDATNKYIYVSPKSSQTIQVCYDVASGHDNNWDLDNKITLTQVGSTENYISQNINFTGTWKYYMFVRINVSGDTYAYYKGTSALSVGGFVSLKDYGTANLGGSGDKINFTPSQSGEYIFVWNHRDKTVRLENAYSVTYDGNDETSGSEPTTTYHLSGITVTVASNSGSLAKDNYSFGGWNTANDGSGDNYAAGSGTFTKAASDETLYAKWTQTVTLDANTANHGSGVAGSATAIWNGETLTGISHPSGATGYSRTGYFTAETGGTKVLNADGTYAGENITNYITDSKWSRTSTTTLYAQWSNEYTITFDQGTPTIQGTDNTTATYGSAMPPVTVPSKTGYIFDGYFYDADEDGVFDVGEETKFYKADGTSNTNWNRTADTELLAIWNPITYFVAFDANEGTGSMSNQEHTYNAELSLTSNSYTRSGYYFLGWNTRADGAGTAYHNSKTVRNLTSVDGKIVTLYAQWAKTYTLYFIQAKCSWTSFYAKAEISYDGQTYYPKGEGNGTTMNNDTRGIYMSNFTYNSSHNFALYKIDGIPEGSQIKFSDNGSDPKGNMSWSPDKPYYLYGNSTWYALNQYAIPADVDTISTATKMSAHVGVNDYGIDQYADGQYAIVELPGGTWYTLIYHNWLEDGWSGCTATGDASNMITSGTSTGVSGEWELNGAKDAHIETTVAGEYKFMLNGWTDNEPAAPKAQIYYPVGVSLAMNKAEAHSGEETTITLTATPAETYLITNPTYYYQMSTDNGVNWTTIATTENTTFDYTFAAIACKFRVVLQNDAGLKSKSTEQTFTVYSTKSFYVYNPYNTSGNWSFLHLYTWDSNNGNTRYNGDFPTGHATNDCGYIQGIDDNINNVEAPKNFRNGNMIEYKGNNWFYITIDERANCFMLVGESTYKDHQTVTCYVSNYREDAKYMIYTRSNANYVEEYDGKKTSDYRLKYTGRGSVTRYSPIYNTTLDKESVTTSMWMNANDATAELVIEQGTGSGWEPKLTCSNSAKNGFGNKVPEGKRDTGYVFQMTLNMAGESSTLTDVVEYTGPYYVRTDGLDGGWNVYKKADHTMFNSKESLHGTPRYDHYLCKWMGSSGTNVKFTVANDYNPALVASLGEDAILGSGVEKLPQATNVRFSWNSQTDTLTRAYLSGASSASSRFLVLVETTSTLGKIYDETGCALTSGEGNCQVSGLNPYELLFADNGNWVYQLDMQANPGAQAKVIAKYNEQQPEFIPSTTLIDGSGVSKYKYRIVYDFKTNVLTNAWLADGNKIISSIILNTNVMLIREEQEPATQLTFGDEITMTVVKKVYGVMQFNKSTITNDGISRYERDLYWISFPFNVNLKDVFGMGDYGTHWIIEYYDGKGRAEHGFWADSPSNWKFVTPAMRENGDDGNGYILETNTGYILALDLDELGSSSSVWENEVTEAYLYFPSNDDIHNIQNVASKDVNINQEGYQCIINRATGTQGDRRIKDSYWHCIGAPSYANVNQTVATEDPIVPDGELWNPEGLLYFYKWNKIDNTLTVQKTTPQSFKAMHSYLVQYSGTTLRWTDVTNTVPASVAARLTETIERDFQLSLIRDSIEEDQTLVRLTDDENVTNRFEFNYDLSKEYNAGKGNIWTVTADTVEVAGNSMPKPVQTTVVPVGVKVVVNGEYTLSMPEGTNGEDVYLIDNAYGTRTNLGLMPYTVTLTAGTYDSRFALEFAPIQDSPTSLENDGLSRSDELNDANDDVRKVFVGGRLYIIRDGKVYDAAGQRVE